MSRSTVSGHYLEGTKGPIFVLLWQPSTIPIGCVLVAPPFAEEMNKCRRMVSEVAMGLAARGVATLVPDLYGTGDSGGDFADGDWATWRADLAASALWSAGLGYPVTSLLAVRLGCALATTGFEAGELSGVTRSVFWQPVFDGSRYLGQFLRLRIAASLMEDRKETMADLKGRLADGETLEVAGYRLSRQLATDLERLTPPKHLPATLGTVAWLEVVREPGAPLPPPSLALIDSSLNRAGLVEATAIPGEPFWSSTEIVVNKVMISRTLSFLDGSEPVEGS